MPRFKYHPPFRISYQYDCNFAKTADTLKVALGIAFEKHPGCLICVDAEAVYDHITVSRAGVGIHAYNASGKGFDEIMELFDKEVDAYIACRVRTGHWVR